MTTARVARWCIGLLALGVAVVGCSSHKSQRSGGTPRTVTKTFRAYGADGELAVQVGDVATGACWTTSVAAPSAHAYRCIAGDQILDPCFAAPKPTSPPEVACLATPWSDAKVIRLTQPLPKDAPPTATARPWAFELANGARCVASTGTVPQIRGVSLGYHCTDGWDAALGKTAASTMTADYGDDSTGRLNVLRVTTIWRT